MKIEYKGYEISESKGHGKAGAGFKKTATMRVILNLHNGYQIKKQFSFKVDSQEERLGAITKCKNYIDNL